MEQIKQEKSKKAAQAKEVRKKRTIEKARKRYKTYQVHAKWVEQELELIKSRYLRLRNEFVRVFERDALSTDLDSDDQDYSIARVGTVHGPWHIEQSLVSPF